MFEKIKQEFCSNIPSLTTLCPTIWTVKAKSFHSVLLNYEALLQTLQDIITGSESGTSNFEVRPKAFGVLHRMETFRLFLELCLLGKSRLILACTPDKTPLILDAPSYTCPWQLERSIPSLQSASLIIFVIITSAGVLSVS